MPKLSAYGPNFFVPFEVRKIKKSRVLWLNSRWFAEMGLDLVNPDIRHQICEELKGIYGVSTTLDTPKEEFFGPAQTLLADRYGGTGGSIHGGSGRAGTCGAYNAKGIGKTPLTPPYVERGHSHGCLSLTDAIREAINAEIASAELPHGAVPVVAIIDTGLVFRPDSTANFERRAILVRPNFLRPAHFERSIYFGSSGIDGSDQHLDALRVQEAVSTVTKQHSVSGGGFIDISAMFLRIAEQIGAAQAHRMWQGLFVTSNISVDGGLVDFGAFRSVPDWRRCRGSNGESFGEEIKPLTSSIESLTFYFRKYAPSTYSVPKPAEIREKVKAKIGTSFLETATSAMSGSLAPQSAQKLSSLLADYYLLQQRQATTIEQSSTPLPWLYDYFAGEPATQSISNEENGIASKIRALYPKNASRADTGMARATLWLKPRPFLVYSIAHKHAISNANWLTGNNVEDERNLTRYIARQVLSSRRLWPEVPASFEPYRAVSDLSSTILLGRDTYSGTYYAHVIGPVFGKSIRVFGIDIATDSIGSLKYLTRSMALTSCNIDSADIYQDTLIVGSTKIHLIQFSSETFVDRL